MHAAEPYMMHHGFLGCIYGICTLSVVILRASGIHITTLRVQIPFTLETHGTTDLYHDTIANVSHTVEGQLATATVRIG